ncbi:MAG TPA: guanylate kinase [Myxococcota bacterium]|nr:guanylate kinase [Myxococcota bacterium]
MSGRAGIPFVVSAPSGTGKTTVCRNVIARDPGVEFSVSHTTRARRPGEQHGRDYWFVTRAEFARMIAAGGFVEHAEYAGNLYGTSWAALDAPLAAGRDLLLEVEVQGALQLRERRRDARFVFLLPPSREELVRRLKGRGTDTADEIARRLAVADGELRAVRAFDYAIVNDTVERATDALLAVIAAERAGDTAAVRERFGRAAVVSSLAGVLPIGD